MLFNTKLFILGYLPLATGGFLSIGRLGLQPALRWILFCSLIFYAWWKPVLVVLLTASILVNFLLGKRVSMPRRRLWLVCGLVFNLGLLGFFKYANFLSSLL